jgi:D-sedoheptulose 7-phosphate isomerase
VQSPEAQAAGLRSTHEALHVFLDRYARVVAADRRACPEGAEMTTAVTATAPRAAFAPRDAPIRALAADAAALAAAAHAMGRRFSRGGRLLAGGRGPSAADAAHVVVEFVHPVIIGKRALPAPALPGGPAAAELALFGEPADIAVAFAPDGSGVADARDRGMLTVALLGGADPPGGEAGAVPGLDHVLVVPSADPRVVREAHGTAYHVLWELVHVFLESDRAPEVLA